MNLELKSKLSHKKTLIILSVISIALALGCCVLGEVILPFLIGVLASLYLIDNDSKRSFGFWVSLVILALNIGGIYLGYVVSFFGPASIIMARLLTRGLKNNKAKSDTAYLMTIVSAAFTLFGFIFLAMVLQNDYSMEGVTSFYKELAAYLRSIFLTSMTEVYTQSGIEVSEKIILSIFDQQLGLIISYLLIGGFVITGIAMKLFSFITSKCLEDNKPIKKWRFINSGLYGYVYVILALAAVFVNPADVIGITVLNLYNFFMYVFAYVGFNYALTLFGRRMKKVTTFILLSIITLVFLTMAVQILAFLGVMFTIRKSREASLTKD